MWEQEKVSKYLQNTLEILRTQLPLEKPPLRFRTEEEEGRRRGKEYLEYLEYLEWEDTTEVLSKCYLLSWGFRERLNRGAGKKE